MFFLFRPSPQPSVPGHGAAGSRSENTVFQDLAVPPRDEQPRHGLWQAEREMIKIWWQDFWPTFSSLLTSDSSWDTLVESSQTLPMLAALTS